MFDENGNGAMAMVNHLMNVKDSRWLQVEVCREFQRGQCSREFNECKFAHPPAHVEVQNGRVTACYDSIKKGKCNRENPKCKYLHPPQHIKDQLLINGRNNLALKNLLMNQLTNAGAYATAPQLASAAAMQQLHPQPNPYLAQQLASVGAAGAGQLGQLSQLGGYGYAGYALPGLYSPPGLPVSLAQTSSATGTTPNPASNDPSPSDALGLATGVAAASAKNRTDRVEALAAVHAAAANNQGSASSPASGIGKKRRLDEASPSPHTQHHTQTALAAAAPTALIQGPQPLLQAAPAQPQLLQQQLLLLQAQQSLAALPPQPATAAAPTPQASPQQQQLLMAAAAMSGAQVGAGKRLAMEAKGGLPVYQAAGDPSSAYAAYAAAAAGQAQPAFAAHFAAPPAAQPPQAYVPALALSGGGAAVTTTAGGGGIAAATAATLPPNANNTASVAYFDESGQLLDTLPVCRDFKQAHCERPSCRYVHLLEDYVEVHEGKVTVCRDFAKGKCSRVCCKYYHVPILHPAQSALLLSQPPASLLAAPAQPQPTSLFSLQPLQSV